MKTRTYLSIPAICLLFVVSFSLLHSHASQENKRKQFIECSKDGGDMVCDSCYFLVYGEHIDTYSLFK